MEARALCLMAENPESKNGQVKGPLSRPVVGVSRCDEDHLPKLEEMKTSG
jgi:hypothetical protein